MSIAKLKKKKIKNPRTIKADKLREYVGEKLMICEEIFDSINCDKIANNLVDTLKDGYDKSVEYSYIKEGGNDEWFDDELI